MDKEKFCDAELVATFITDINDLDNIREFLNIVETKILKEDNDGTSAHTETSIEEIT